MKKCKVCNKEKEITEFPLRVEGYRRSECNKCVAKWQREYRKNNQHHIRLLEACRNYKITYEEAELLYTFKSCQICGEKFKKIGNIDNDHETGKVRGVLCTNCNFGLGYFKDNKELLMKAMKYLDNGKKPILEPMEL